MASQHSPPAPESEAPTKKVRTSMPALNFATVTTTPAQRSQSTTLPPTQFTTPIDTTLQPPSHLNATPMSLPPTAPQSAGNSARKDTPLENDKTKKRRSSVGVTADFRLSLQSISETPNPSTNTSANTNTNTVSRVLPPSTNQTGGAWTLSHDESSDKNPYYLNSITGESRWAHLLDTTYMEVLDSESGCLYLEHSVSGDTKWIQAEKTVWEEVSGAERSARGLWKT